MADEVKTEQTEAEKLIESLDAGTGEDGKESVEESGAPQKKEAGEVKGWTTSLPKKFRESAKDFDSLESYLESLHSAKKEVDSEQDETDEDWETAIGSIGAEDAHDKAIINAMRAHGIRSDKAKSLYGAIKLEGEAAVAEYALSVRKATSEHFAKRRKESDNYDAVLRNGFQAIQRNNPEAFLSAKGTGLFNQPAVLDIVYMIGKGDTESGPMSSRTNTKTNGYDPSNPLRYKD